MQAARIQLVLADRMSSDYQGGNVGDFRVLFDRVHILHSWNDKWKDCVLGAFFLGLFVSWKKRHERGEAVCVCSLSGCESLLISREKDKGRRVGGKKKLKSKVEVALHVDRSDLKVMDGRSCAQRAVPKGSDERVLNGWDGVMRHVKCEFWDR